MHTSFSWRLYHHRIERPTLAVKAHLCWEDSPFCWSHLPEDSPLLFTFPEDSFLAVVCPNSFFILGWLINTLALAAVYLSVCVHVRACIRLCVSVHACGVCLCVCPPPSQWAGTKETLLMLTLFPTGSPCTVKSYLFWPPLNKTTSLIRPLHQVLKVTLNKTTSLIRPLHQVLKVTLNKTTP